MYVLKYKISTVRTLLVCTTNRLSLPRVSPADYKHTQLYFITNVVAKKTFIIKHK